ncbi:MAG: hypothetical protein ACUVSA_09585 [Desulfosoma sp.]|uniref:hypothetical protein n=1 Tax=Desulfosoma sp. TaxID=2603217 RepID=UPI0040495254
MAIAQERVPSILGGTPLLLRVFSDGLRDGVIHYRFTLVPFHELHAQEALETDLRCLRPFVPLMHGGLNLAEKDERKIYDSDLPQ